MYHVSRNGQQQGPFTEDQIKSMIANGEVQPQDLVWKQGDPTWQPASARLAHLFGSGPPNPFAPPSAAYGQAYAQWQQPSPLGQNLPPPDLLIWAILSTLLCCLPFGIPAIVYSSQVKSKYFAGNYRGAYEASEKSKFWCWMAFGFGLPFALFWMIYLLLFLGILAAATAAS
jgi:hypothetical protein